ncbi:MAG: hypothetical protein WCQ26_09990 [Pseudanabaena sp. ELA748]
MIIFQEAIDTIAKSSTKTRSPNHPHKKRSPNHPQNAIAQPTTNTK